MAKPTDAELAILRVLWAEHPCTVREVHERLGASGAYTTTLKTMQIMHNKTLVGRDTSQRSHRYHPLVEEARVQGSLVSDLMDKAFGGSAARLAMRALGDKPASRQEIDELRALLDEMEEK